MLLNKLNKLSRKTIIIISISVISFILILILIISLASSKNNLPNMISLPLKTSHSYNDLSSLLKNNIKTTITISDKNQEIDLFLSPNDYNLFITQQDILFKNFDNSQINKFSKNFYDYEFSSSIKLLSERTKYSFSQYNFARKAQENFNLCEKNSCTENSIKLIDFKFLLAEDPYDKISGGIGLSPSYTFENEVANIFDELYEGKYINKKVWYINYDNDDDKKLIIGKYPYEVDDSFQDIDFTFFDVKGRDWGFEMLNIIIGNDNKENSDNYIKEKNFAFNPDSSLIYGPYEYYQKIKNIFFIKYLSENKCSENIFEIQLIEYLSLTCDSDISLSNFPPLMIDINNYFKFELTQKDLFFKNGNKQIFLFVTNKIERYSGRWFMGEPFLKKYKPIYNQGESKIGFYNVIVKNQKTYRILGILGFIFFIICTGITIYLCFYLFRKYRNKKIRRAAMEMRIEEISNKLVTKQNENNI